MAGAKSEVTADSASVSAARKAAEEDIDDDMEIESRTDHAVQTVGAWMRPMLGTLSVEIRHVDQALAALGLEVLAAAPLFDERFSRVEQVIDDHLRTGKQWRDDAKTEVSSA